MYADPMSLAMPITKPTRTVSDSTPAWGTEGTMLSGTGCKESPSVEAGFQCPLHSEMKADEIFRGEPVSRTDLPVPNFSIVPFQHYCRNVPSDVVEHGDLRKADFASPEWPRLFVDRWNVLCVVESLFNENWTIFFDEWYEFVSQHGNPHELTWEPPPPEVGQKAHALLNDACGVGGEPRTACRRVAQLMMQRRFMGKYAKFLKDPTQNELTFASKRKAKQGGPAIRPDLASEWKSDESEDDGPGDGGTDQESDEFEEEWSREVTGEELAAIRQDPELKAALLALCPTRSGRKRTQPLQLGSTLDHILFAAVRVEPEPEPEPNPEREHPKRPELRLIDVPEFTTVRRIHARLSRHHDEPLQELLQVGELVARQSPKKKNKKRKRKPMMASTPGDILIASDDHFCVWGECMGARMHKSHGFELQLRIDPVCVELVTAIRAQVPTFSGWQWKPTTWVRCSSFHVFRWDPEVLGVLLAPHNPEGRTT
jgi:hypothetical protein